MVITTKVNATNYLSPEEAQSLENSLDNLLESYRLNNNSLNLEWITPILGTPPTIPNSPDLDAMLDAWEDRAEYGRKVEFIERVLKELAG